MTCAACLSKKYENKSMQKGHTTYTTNSIAKNTTTTIDRVQSYRYKERRGGALSEPPALYGSCLARHDAYRRQLKIRTAASRHQNAGIGEPSTHRTWLGSR
ncbi:unnamed protein product [Laminaria digitata]